MEQIEEKKASEIAAQLEEPETIHINLEDGKPSPDIESMCMYCHKQGITKFMMTKIPFFKEVMISSFACEHCGFRNSEVTFAGKLEDYGCRYELNVINNIAFNRTVVKSEFASIEIPEAGLEIPAQT